jgi:phage shock protein C
MYCTRCGTQIQETDNFCAACGDETPRATETRRESASSRIAPRRLYRLVDDKKIAGVCAGLAKYFNVDVTLVRLAVITAIVFSGGIGLLAYIAAWIIMPTEPSIPERRSAANNVSRSPA